MVRIFKWDTSISIFSTTQPSLAQQRKQMRIITFDNTCDLIIGFGNYIYAIRDYYQSYILLFAFLFGCLYNSIVTLWNADFQSYCRGSFFIFQCWNQRLQQICGKAYVLNFTLSKPWSVIPQLSQNRPRLRCFF